MITRNETTTTIQCDKCKIEQHAPNGCYNEVFYTLGWALKRGRKYEHLCYNCLPSRSKKAMNFVKEHFGHL